MVTQTLLGEARERTRKAFESGDEDRRTAAAARLRAIADTLCSSASDFATLAAAERLIEHVRRGTEARAAFYSIEAIGPETEAVAFNVFAHVGGVRLIVAPFGTFDEAQSYVGDVYRRRGASFSIDRVATGKFQTRPFRIGTTNATLQEGTQS
jgi:hypothetical protein